MLLLIYLLLFPKLPPLVFVLYDISVSKMCIYRDYCMYHYKSAELVYSYTLDIGLKINTVIITFKDIL